MFEIIVSISLFVIVLLLIGSIYSIAQKAYNTGSNEAELSQNMRVSLDRISRELRQSTNIVSPLPATDDEAGNPPPNEIFFQDGHDISQINYIRYYIDGTNLMRRFSYYYFEPQPTTHVLWNAVDAFGDPPSEYIVDDRITGEYLNNLQFWGNFGVINIYMEYKKGDNNLKIGTKIFVRN